ncbi:MAG: ParB N-terminal domain-containing protein [Deltaproteobacteria bacterium]|nr:ParB N-terminal domain-containing protein [Deltaproteobacteria bacterium]
MSNLTKGSDAIGKKIKEHMIRDQALQQEWPQERREQLWNAVLKSEQQIFAKIPVNLILASKNIRRGGDDAEISKLVSSIRSDGLIQSPVVCLEKDDSGQISFVTVAGHRRLKALEVLGICHVDCAIKVFSKESDRLVSSFIENDVRKNMDPFDIAVAYSKMKESGLSAAEIALRTNKDISSVNRLLKFNTWSDDLVARIRSMDKLPAVRDLFALLPLKEGEIVDRLALDRNIDGAQSKKEQSDKQPSIRLAAHEKRYSTLTEIVTKYDINDAQKAIFSKILTEAKIIRKAL